MTEFNFTLMYVYFYRFGLIKLFQSTNVLIIRVTDISDDLLEISKHFIAIFFMFIQVNKIVKLYINKIDKHSW